MTKTSDFGRCRWGTICVSEEVVSILKGAKVKQHGEFRSRVVRSTNT